MKVSKVGLELIAKFEQLKPRAYYATDHEASQGIKTIGYGHVILPGEAHLKDIWLTPEQALELLEKDAAKFESGVTNLIGGPTAHLSQNQFDAIVSLAFNVGLGGFQKSNVRRHILLGNIKEASSWFKSFTKQAGTRLKGLVRRRAIEKIYYDTGVVKYEEVFSGRINPYEELGIDE